MGTAAFAYIGYGLATWAPASTSSLMVGKTQESDRPSARGYGVSSPT